VSRPVLPLRDLPVGMRFRYHEATGRVVGVLPSGVSVRLDSGERTVWSAATEVTPLNDEEQA